MLITSIWPNTVRSYSVYLVIFDASVQTDGVFDQLQEFGLLVNLRNVAEKAQKAGVCVLCVCGWREVERGQAVQ